MDLVILNNFFLRTYFRNKGFLIDYFTGSKLRININMEHDINNNLAILMMPQPQNYNFGNCRLKILQLFTEAPQNEDPLCPLPWIVPLQYLFPFLVCF